MILIIQQIDGNIIAPKILGDSTRLSSLGVIIAITIMGAYFGLVGMIIGVPIFSMIVSVITELIDARLKKANMPTDTAEYFARDSLVDPYEHHERMLPRIGKAISFAFKKISSLVTKKKDKQNESEESQENQENEESK